MKRTLKTTVGLSKSLLMKGLQCPKQLYLHTFHPDLAPPIGEAQQALFDQGNEVGIEAQKRFPEGILIEADYWDIPGAFAKTQAAIAEGALILFEATLVHDGVSARADVLKRKSLNNPWEIVEVKSSTSVKDEYLDDVAIQLWVFKNFGLDVRKVSVMHINNQYVHPDQGALFTIVDVTEEALSMQRDITSLVKKMKLILNSKTAPKTDIGAHCYSPYECGFIKHCFKQKKIPNPSIFDLPGLGSKAWDFYGKGIIAVDDPTLEGLSGVAGRALEVHRTGKRFVDRTEIVKELAQWSWPLSYLDFETIGHAVPKINETRPYQQLPFQFSLHIQEKPGAIPTHKEFLHTDDSDPREDLAKALLTLVPKEGSIVAYNMGFEMRVIRELAELFPKYRKRLEELNERFVDPLPLLRRAVYDKQFGPSFSIKSVAPALIGDGLSYDSLEVGDGETAQLAFKEMISRKTSKPRKASIEGALLEYCKQDTLAMVKLVEWLLREGKETGDRN